MAAQPPNGDGFWQAIGSAFVSGMAIMGAAGLGLIGVIKKNLADAAAKKADAEKAKADEEKAIADRLALNVPEHEKFINQSTQDLVKGLNSRIDGLTGDLNRAVDRIKNLEDERGAALDRAIRAEANERVAVVQAAEERRRAEVAELQRDMWMVKANDTALRQTATVIGLKTVAEDMTAIVETDTRLIDAPELRRPAAVEEIDSI